MKKKFKFDWDAIDKAEDACKGVFAVPSGKPKTKSEKTGPKNYRVEYKSSSVIPRLRFEEDGWSVYSRHDTEKKMRQAYKDGKRQYFMYRMVFPDGRIEF